MMCWRLFGNSEIYRQNDGCFQQDVPKGNLQVLADTIIYEYGQAILFRFFRMLTWRVARVLLRSKSTAFLFQAAPPRGGRQTAKQRDQERLESAIVDIIESL